MVFAVDLYPSHPATPREAGTERVSGLSLDSYRYRRLFVIEELDHELFRALMIQNAGFPPRERETRARDP